MEERICVPIDCLEGPEYPKELDGLELLSSWGSPRLTNTH